MKNNALAKINFFPLVLLAAMPGSAHELITTKLTWSKEISRIVYQRCASCHHKNGPAFSLLQYEEARPWARAIQEQTSLRQMPPWNAVKGFGAFSPDHGLSQDDIATISAWVEGGAPEGDPNHLPPKPRIDPWEDVLDAASLAVASGQTIQKPLNVIAVRLINFTAGQSAKLYAELPGGQLLPLIWIHQYSPRAPNRYTFARNVHLPAGTLLHTVSSGPGSFALMLAD